MKKRISVIFVVLAFACGGLLAQNISSSIVGNVTDQQGAVVPDAQVIVKNTETGITVQAKTDNAGTYSVPGILAGAYTVTVKKNGFEISRTDGVRVFSAQNKRVDVKLSVGGMQQTVTVTDHAPLITTDSMTIGDSVTASQLANLPTSQQTVDAFVALAPGVQVKPGGDATNPIIGGGSHWGGVNYTLNGVELNDPGNGGGVTVQGVGLLVMPPPSSIQELNVQSGNMSAKYTGHASVTLVTKGGTNAFHGLVYEYLQNTALNANSFVLNANGDPRPPTHLNQFGGNIGGPIWRDKAFFFFDYNGFRNQDSVPVQLTFPSMKMRSGDFSDLGVQLYDPQTGKAFAGNVIPDNMIASQAKQLLKYLPAPTDATSIGKPSGGINYVAAVPRTQTVDAYDARIEYNISSSDRIFGVFARRVADPWNAHTNYPANYGQGRYGYKDVTISGTETHTFNQTTLNELRVAWGDYGTKFSGQNLDVNPQDLFPQMPATMFHGLPTMTMTGYTGMFHDYGTGLYTPRWNVEITDNFTHIQGRHTLEAGIDETGYKIDTRVPAAGVATGSFAFNGKWTGNKGWPGQPQSAGNTFADFLLGDASADSTAPTGAYAKDIYSRDWGAYVQDTWQATPKMTLIFGLRYEYQSPWLYKNQEVTTFDMANDKLVIPQNSDTPTLPANASADLFNAYPIETTHSIGLPLHYIQPDRNNFAPRVGFAYRPFADGRTVIRGGFGIYYNFQPGNVGSRADAFNPPWTFSISQDFSSLLPGKPKTPYLPDLTFTNPFPSTNTQSVVTPNPTINMLQWDFQNASTQEWSLTVEHEFGQDWSAKATYMGHVGHNLPYNFGPINVPDVQIPNMPIQKQRPFQPFGAINATRSVGTENFNQMQLGLKRRFSSGLSFQAEYQFSKGLDDVPTSGGPQRWQHPELDYGNSVGLARHWLTFNYVYELPFGKGRQFLHGMNGVEDAVIGGWKIAGISTYYSGTPFSVNFSTAGTGITGWWGGRADQVPGVSLTQGRSHSHDILSGVPWFNTDAFVAPQPWQWGTSARDLMFGPGGWNWDMSGSKNFHMWERLNMNFRADFFDAFNHFNLGNPSTTVPDLRDGGTPIKDAGMITSGDGQRSIQLSLSAKF
jgi:hypothetical protein